MSEHITGVTIAQNGTVSYEGTRPSLTGNGENVRFTATTYERWERFDWARLPRDCRVLDLEGADIPTVWATLISRDHPSFSSKVQACRLAGLRTTTVGTMRKRASAVPF